MNEELFLLSVILITVLREQISFKFNKFGNQPERWYYLEV